MSAPSSREEGFLCGPVFLVSMAGLLLQITLTRTFSFTIWYRFAYVTISVARLGYGASGPVLGGVPRLARARPDQCLSM